MGDLELGLNFITGGENELIEIIRLYSEKLLRYATAILCDYHQAEDVVQEVFITSYQNRETFDGKNLSAWLYKITYNRCLNQLKKRKPIYLIKTNYEVTTISDEKNLSDETLNALLRLKPKERAIIYGRIMEEQSYDALSVILGRNPTALRKQYERAKKNLASYLIDEYFGEEKRYE